MHPLKFFLDRIGKKVIAANPVEQPGAVHIKDEAHAVYLHKTQAASNYNYHEPYGEDKIFPDILTGVLVAEILCDTSPDLPNTDTSSEFGGGSFDGSGASGDW